MPQPAHLTALVTGSEGFLGGYICAVLHAAGWQVYGLDRQPATRHDILAGYYPLTLPSAQVRGVLAALRPNAIVHAAGSASVGASLADPAQDFQASVGALLSVLDAARLAAPEARVVFLSSAAVYGNPARLPIDENAPHQPLSPYGYHKSLCEQLLQEFYKFYGLRSAALRLFSAYGPGLQRQVMWDICQKALRGGAVELFGTGDESRDFIHAHDAAQAVRLVLQSAPCEAEAYNLAAGVETRIRDLAEMLLAALGGAGPVQFSGAARPGDPQRWRADLERITRLGFQPQISLAEGVAGYARWVRG